MQEDNVGRGHTVEQDRRAKWEAGVREHGPIMAFDPLVELYNESLDGTNYAEQLAEDPGLRDDRDLLLALAAQFRRCAKVSLYLRRKHVNRVWMPTPVEFK